MARPLVTVPLDLLRVSAIDWDIDWRGQPPSESTADTTQVIYNRFPRWVGSLGLIHQRGDIGRWRALRLSAQGRAGIYRLPMVDPGVFNPKALLSGSQAGVYAPLLGSPQYAPPVGLDDGPFVYAATAAAAGATEVRLTVPSMGHVPVVGQIISADDWPMAVTSVTYEGGSTYLVGVQMPLRAAIASGGAISLVGIGRFEVLDDMAGRGAYGVRPVSTPSIEFREVLTR